VPSHRVVVAQETPIRTTPRHKAENIIVVLCVTREFTYPEPMRERKYPIVIKRKRYPDPA
jgi:hypothetical protein